MAPYRPRVSGERAGQNPEHSSGLISSLLVAADVADDVGDVLVAFFLIGDEGGIVIVVVFDRLVDLDVVLRLGNDGLDLAGIFLGIGFLERHQLFGLDLLRRCFGGGGCRWSTGARGGSAAAESVQSARPRRCRARSPGSCSGRRISCLSSGKYVWFRDRIWPRVESWEFLKN